MRKITILLGAIIGLGALVYALKDRVCSYQNPKEFAENLLAQADIKINGNRPWDMTVHNENLYMRVMQEGSLGLGEAYMDGWWDCKSLDQFFYHLLKADIDQKTTISSSLIINYVYAQLCNLQSKSRASQVGEQHYDLSNELFEKMLDKRMIYSCGYWKDATTLDEAQEHKLDLICKKLQLKPGMTLLDIGCGWGGLAKYAAENYGAKVTGITISKEQAAYTKEHIGTLPIDIRVQDYRDLHEQFDRMVSVGMFEHVGYKNYQEYIEVAHRCLKDGGLFLLHTIGTNVSTTFGDPWIDRYIFPNGMLPSIVQIAQVIENRFIMEDWHNFGPDYDKTLMAWHANFLTHWPELKAKYSERFYRMWVYYLLSCAGLFRARKAQLWQIVLSKGRFDRYQSVR